MAAIKFYLSTKKGEYKPIYCEVRLNQTIHKRFKTRLAAPADKWNDKAQGVNIPKYRIATPDTQREIEGLSNLNKELAVLRAEIEQTLLGGYDESKLSMLIGGERMAVKVEPTLADGILEYSLNARLSTGRKRQYKVVSRKLQRFSEYTGRTMRASETTIDDLEEITRFIETEYTLQHSTQYQKRVVSKSETPIEEIGRNRLVTLMKMVKAYFNHQYKVGAITANPFDKYEMLGEVYGTPYYLTGEELRKVSQAATPWQVQQDIFVFHCCVGCRVSDLQRLTWDNIETDTNGVYWLSYIPQKTSNERAQVVSVPLNDMAVEIIERYKDAKGWRLLPCISSQKYNVNIKHILQYVGITRKVTIRNAKTGESEQVRICDVASSHMARRTFCGGLYNSGIDSRVICSMSGHTEGSKAFSRYSTPTDEQKKRAIFNR